jgi:hypothetical protein
LVTGSGLTAGFIPVVSPGVTDSADVNFVVTGQFGVELPHLSAGQTGYALYLIGIPPA